MKTTTFLGLACLAALVATSPARADTLSDIKARHKLLVGIDLGLPPYGTVDAAMQPTGSDVEAARLLAADLGVALEIVPTTGANRIPFLQTHKVDAVMASFSITEARKKVVDFSIPYGVISIICAAPAGTAIRDAKDLDGKTVALMDIGKSRGKEFIDRLEGHFKKAGIATKRYAKPTNTKVAPLAVMQQMAAEAQLAVIALSD